MDGALATTSKYRPSERIGCTASYSHNPQYLVSSKLQLSKPLAAPQIHQLILVPVREKVWEPSICACLYHVSVSSMSACGSEQLVMIVGGENLECRRVPSNPEDLAMPSKVRHFTASAVERTRRGCGSRPAMGQLHGQCAACCGSRSLVVGGVGCSSCS